MARICQKCGDPGFQEVMIYCRQCRISCEHKYCLFKFPKKGEKVRWYCEECKPTVFPVSSPDKLEDDTERSKIELKCVQTPKNQNQIQYQNQNQNQKTKSPSASNVSQLEKVQEKSKSLNPPSSNFGENGQPLKQGTSILPNKDPVDKNLPNTPLFCPAPSTSCGETTVQKEAKSLKSPLLVLGENGQAQKRSHVLSNKDQVNQNISNTPLARLPPPATCGETIVQEEAKSLRSPPLDFGKNGRFQNQRSSILSNKDQVNQNVRNTPLAHSSPPTTCGETTVEEEAKNVKSPSNFDENGQFQKLRRSILSTKDQVDQSVPNSLLAHSPLPSTCGKTNVHEVSAPETPAHRINTHQEIEVYNPEQVDQIDPYVARPMIYYIWRGCISFGDNNFVPFRAHGSTIAGQRVFDAALLLPPILPVDKYLRRDLCPTIFKNGPPTYESIGLYFLPDDHASLELVFHLIDEIIKKDLMFVYAFDEIELLVLPSCMLPKEHHKIQGQYYLWAAFRNKQLPTAVTPANNNPEPTIENKENKQDKQEDLTCSKSQKAAANATKKHTRNEEIHGNNLNSLITEKKRLVLDGENKKRVREENENLSKNVTTSDSENQKPVENISKRCKQEEMTASRPSKCIEKLTHNQVTKKELAENKETHASIPIDKCAKQMLADRSKEQSRYLDFAKNYVSDFYRKRNTGDEKQRVLAGNEKIQRQEKDEINANNVPSSAWTRKQRPVHVLEGMKKFSQNREKLCPSSPISKSAELQKVADESKKKERNSYQTHANKINRICAEKQLSSYGLEKLVVSKDEKEKHTNSLRRKSDHCRNQTCTSNPYYSLASEKQKPAGTLNSKCIENQKPIHGSKESSKRVGEKDETRVSVSIREMDVDKSKVKEQKKDVEHAVNTPISTCTEKQKLETNNERAHEGSKLCASSSVRTCAEEHNGIEDTNKKHSTGDEKMVGSEQLPLEETKKKPVCDENEIVSTPLLKGSPTAEKEGDGAETVASNRIEKARKKDADNEVKMEKISQNVGEVQVSPFGSTCTDEQKAREKTKNFNDSEELEEGEICDDFFGREGEINGSGYDNDADDHCLSLFPLKVEDMGVVSKVGSGAKVSLDLGLGRS